MVNNFVVNSGLLALIPALLANSTLQRLERLLSLAFLVSSTSTVRMRFNFIAGADTYGTPCDADAEAGHSSHP